MDNLFTTFVSKFSSLPPVLTFIVMVLLIVSYFYKDAISKKIQQYKTKREINRDILNGNYRFEDLMYHDVFSVIFEVRAAIKHHDFDEEDGGETKTRVFHDFLNIMLEEIHLNMKCSKS